MNVVSVCVKEDLMGSCHKTERLFVCLFFKEREIMGWGEIDIGMAGIQILIKDVVVSKAVWQRCLKRG